MTPIEAQTRLSYRIAGMAMAAFLRGLRVESVQAFGFRDDILIYGLDSPAVLMRPDATYEMKEPIILQRGMLEMAALTSLAKYLGVGDPFSLNVDNVKNVRMFVKILEPLGRKAEGVLKRLEIEAAELVTRNWSQIVATVEAMREQGRVEGEALVDLLSYGKVQPIPPNVKRYELPREIKINRAGFFV
jgi:hypothetical protein